MVVIPPTILYKLFKLVTDYFPLLLLSLMYPVSVKLFKPSFLVKCFQNFRYLFMTVSLQFLFLELIHLSLIVLEFLVEPHLSYFKFFKNFISNEIFLLSLSYRKVNITQNFSSYSSFLRLFFLIQYLTQFLKILYTF